MAKNTSSIVDLETQMAEVQLKLDTQYQDLKEAICALAATTKDNIDTLAASIARVRQSCWFPRRRMPIQIISPSTNTFVTSSVGRRLSITIPALSFLPSSG
ncbi:unnamed protein product [Linum trigynum]|uniref:Uncharacterized protein n=1 Tax=Linum trigynum TaxID=586398 RepID=A0AAV2GN70_9ROSI